MLRADRHRPKGGGQFATLRAMSREANNPAGPANYCCAVRSVILFRGTHVFPQKSFPKILP